MSTFGSPRAAASSYNPTFRESSPVRFPSQELTKRELIVREISAVDPFELYRRLRNRTRLSFILESAPGPKRLAQFTFIGFDPVAVFALQDGVLLVDGERRDRLWSPT